MAACNSSAEFYRLSPELLTLILINLPAKSVLNVSETCRHLNKITFGCDVLWKRLSMLHFKVDVLVKLPTVSFYQLYQLMYKYRVVLQNQIYGNYVPEYFYHWSVLMGSNDRLFFSGFSYLINSRFKKTWDISKSDIAKVSNDFNCIHTSVRALKEKLGDKEDFQKVLLQRCMRNQRKISQHFVTASIHSRASRLSIFLRDNPEYKSILMTKIPLPKFLPDFDDLDILAEVSLDMLPREIAFDFIKGHFHKSGFLQVKNYVKFSQMLENKFSSTKSLSRNVNTIATKIYSKFQQCAKLRLITCEDYMQGADEYFDRLDEIEYWQREIKEKSKFYFNSDGLTEQDAYHNYIVNGDVADLTLLQRHYEGLHNIRIWLVENVWIEELLGSTMRDILVGKPCKIFISKIYEEIHKLVTRYLETGQSQHFRTLIRKVYLHATSTLESKAKHLEKLKGDLDNKNVFPSNDWLQDETSSDTVSL